MRFRFCTACDAAPFHRLSIALKTKTLPVRSSATACTRQMFVSRTSRTPGGVAASSTNGSSRVRARVQLVDLGLLDRRASA